jgi:hypothetical protein
MKKLLLIFFIIPIQLFAQSQQLNYDILMKDEKIGTMKVLKITQKDHISYTIESTITVNKFVSMLVEYRSTAEFHRGKMIKSSNKQMINGKVQNDTRTTWDGNQYDVYTLTGRSKLKERSIDYDVCMLYFDEPDHRKKIYSDALGKWVNIKTNNNHQYDLLLPESKRSTYTFNYGICSRVETEQMFSKITLLLTK